VRTTCAVIAASTADPPSSKISSAASEASGWAVATANSVKTCFAPGRGPLVSGALVQPLKRPKGKKRLVRNNQGEVERRIGMGIIISRLYYVLLERYGDERAKSRGISRFEIKYFRESHGSARFPPDSRPGVNDPVDGSTKREDMYATTGDTGSSPERITPEQLRSQKGGTPIVALTAYTAPQAKFLDAHCDLLLVGDSLAMVVYGLETTRGVTLDIMIAHGRAVVRGAQQALVVVDLPHGTYESDPAQAVLSAKRVMEETGAQAVKLEGGEERAAQVAAIVDAGIPVLGHVGLLPQKAEHRGAFKIQGKDDAGARQVMADAHAIAKAGAFALVIEGTVEPVARAITAEIDIPTIGIGASPSCDGQILVTNDMVGLFADFTPKFVKRYADLGSAMEEAAKTYAEEVRARTFPGLEHCFGVPKS